MKRRRSARKTWVTRRANHRAVGSHRGCLMGRSPQMLPQRRKSARLSLPMQTHNRRPLAHRAPSSRLGRPPHPSDTIALGGLFPKGWKARRARSNQPTHIARRLRTIPMTPLPGRRVQGRTRRGVGRTPVSFRGRNSRPVRRQAGHTPGNFPRRSPHRISHHAGRIPGSSPPRRPARQALSPPHRVIAGAGSSLCHPLRSLRVVHMLHRLIRRQAVIIPRHPAQSPRHPTAAGQSRSPQRCSRVGSSPTRLRMN